MAPPAMYVLLVAAALAVLLSQAGARVDLANNNASKALYPSHIVGLINSDPSTGWKAGVNKRFLNSTLGHLRRMGGALLASDFPGFIRTSTAKISTTDLDVDQIPSSFDARTAWNCPSMRTILDQGSCGSCWAFSAVQVIQDRMCVQHGLDVALSQDDILTCCGSCGNCDMGWPERAYEFMATQGAVSSQCSPYFDTSTCPDGKCRGADTPTCRTACANNEDYRSNRYYCQSPYFVQGIPAIQSEILRNGPVTAVMRVYEDFSYYTEGVYRYRYGDFILRHAVKLVGWGYMPETGAYWIATNQWGHGWGEGGHFRIAMGVNECGVEENVLAAMPVNQN